MRNAMIFRLFVAVLVMLCNVGVARAEYILRLPNLPDIHFENAEMENIPTPFGTGNRPGEHDWTQNIGPRRPDDTNKNYTKEDLDLGFSRIWSRIRPRERIILDFDLPHFDPSVFRDHKMIFYTTRGGVLIANGKEIMFPYSQIMIDKNHLQFLEPYRRCFRDITPQGWLPDEPRMYASVRIKIRGGVDRLETDEPSVWEGKVGFVRFMDVYLRDIEVLNIECK